VSLCGRLDTRGFSAVDFANPRFSVLLARYEYSTCTQLLISITRSTGYIKDLVLFCSTGLERDRVNEILTVRLYPGAGETLANVIRHSNDLNSRKVESTSSRCLPAAKILYVRQDGVYRAKHRQA